MPRLSAAVMAEAPGVTLQMLDHPSSDALRLLGEGAIDIGVEASSMCRTGCAPSSCSSRSSSRRRRRDHPVLAEAGFKPGDRIPPDIYCAIPQVLMSMDGGRNGTWIRCSPSAA